MICIGRIAGSFLVAFSMLALVSNGSAAQTPPPANAPPAAKPKSQGTTTPAPAPTGDQKPEAKSGPDMTTETYGDWMMRCQPVQDAKRCEVTQTITIQGQQKPIAQVALGREKKSDPIRFVVQLPTNITFDGGVKASTADGSTTIDMPFKRCFPIGCFADAPLDDALLDKLKKQSEPGSVKFKDGTDREIALPFSFKGFAPAVEALARL